jgi:glycosyltransferase involved in cell wall biosynthesis
MKLDISDLWKKRAPQRNLKILGHVSDRALVELYVKARAVIQPSLMEGFGLTALEAMSCGAPVIAASAGALPEVVGVPEALFNRGSARYVVADRTGMYRPSLADVRRTWPNTSEAIQLEAFC